MKNPLGRKKTRLLALGVILLTALAAGGAIRRSPTVARALRERTVPAPDTGVVAAHTAFGFDLFTRLAKEKSRENVFFSGPSAALALSMIANGAGGDTRAGMEKALHVSGLGMNRVNAGNRAVRLGLRAWDPQIQVSIANAAWTDLGLKPSPEFRWRLRHLYDAEMRDIPLKDPAAILTINGWVKEETGGKIERLVDSIPPATEMVLASAIYFHGEWQQKFDRSQTRDEDFIHHDGRRVPIPMMRQSETFPYTYGEGFQAIALPYGGGRISMVIVLPDKPDGLPALLDDLTPQTWADWMGRMSLEAKEVILPRFRIEDANTLDGALKAMGMPLAYESGIADFAATGVDPGYLCLSTVRQKALLEVDEEGATAAAATYDNLTTAVAMPAGPVRVDHPFLCAIRDNETGEVLFLGAIYDPQRM